MSDSESPDSRDATTELFTGDSASVGDGKVQRNVAHDETAGDRIGPYVLIEEIGVGGFGVVYRARQEEPIRREVALKIIKLGMDTRQVVARFDAERQALAMMDHPNIARALDAGSTERGRLYFVMELVTGQPINAFCDHRRLNVEQRLRLFLDVCAAVQHAHQKGVIHRDIKPSNIMVAESDGRFVVKVIDFGIAKATYEELTDLTVVTLADGLVGTPAYMSPEQTIGNQQDIDTRTDIYSLGVALYELLTGQPPLNNEELMKGGYPEICRRIQHEEAAPPSTRVRRLEPERQNVLASARGADASRLLRDLRGELDWITLKALEKDRDRRYETANALRLDLQRLLDNEPVLACPPSAFYRFRKLVRRNRLTFSSGAAAILALVLGLGFSTRMYFKEREAHERMSLAEREQNRLRELAVAARETEATLRKEADAARTLEASLRKEAEDNALEARRMAYAADVNLARIALDQFNRGRALELLERHRPRIVWPGVQSETRLIKKNARNSLRCPGIQEIRSRGAQNENESPRFALSARSRCKVARRAPRV